MASGVYWRAIQAKYLTPLQLFQGKVMRLMDTSKRIRESDTIRFILQ